jgi:hypothetical protein
MTSRGKALILAENLGAGYGWSKITDQEFFTGQGAKHPFTIATFSMQLSNGEPAGLFVATIPVSPLQSVTVMAETSPGFGLDLATLLITFVRMVGAG